jgi:hypothetical protein
MKEKIYEPVREFERQTSYCPRRTWQAAVSGLAHPRRGAQYQRSHNKLNMKKIAALLALLFSVAVGFSQEQLTPERFREIVATPGDNVPLQPKLAAGSPLWTNATVNVVLKYQIGKVFTEEITQTAKTIGGKYIVFTGQSQFYHQPMSSILTFDEKASALKIYGLYGDGHGGDIVTEGLIVYDYEKKIYAASAAYGEGFKEITVGSYSKTESSDRTLVYKDGVLSMTREVKTRPVVEKK